MGLPPSIAVLLLLLGLPVGLYLCSGLLPARSLAARMGTAALAGIGAIVAVAHCAMALGIPARVGLPVLAALGGVGATWALIRLRRRRLQSGEPSERGALRSLAADAAPLLLVALLLWVPFTEARELAVSEHDAINIWAPKAQVALDEAPPRFDTAAEHTHPAYPRGFPLMIAAAALGAPVDPTIPRLVPLLLFALTLLCAFDALSMRGNFAGATAAVVILGSLPLALHHATSGYADVPLAGFILLSGVGLACGRGGAPAVPVALAGALGAAVTKDEGLAYGLGFAAVLAVTLLRRGAPKAALAAAATFAVLAGPWACLRMTAPVAGAVSLRSAAQNAGLLLLRFDQIVLESAHIALGATDPAPEGLPVPGRDLVIDVGIVCALVLAIGRRGSFRVLPVVLLLLADGIAMLWSPQPVRWHLVTALARLVLQCLPLLLVAALDKLTTPSELPADYPARTRT